MEKKHERSKTYTNAILGVEIAKKTYRVTSRTKDFDQRIFVSSQPLKKEHDLSLVTSCAAYVFRLVVLRNNN